MTLYYYEGLTLAEIGQVLGVTESRICQMHTKAVLGLKGEDRRSDPGRLNTRKSIPGGGVSLRAYEIRTSVILDLSSGTSVPALEAGSTGGGSGSEPA